MTIVDSTVVGVGGTPSQLLDNEGSARLVNDTFSGPGMPTKGSVETAAAPAVTSAVNTIFAGATSAGNCSGLLTSLGHNLDDGTTCGLTGPRDLSKTDPQLGSLGDNGGPTATEALLAGSAAVDAGDPSACPPVDQRGVQRPAGSGCDIGAYEFAITADLAIELKAAPKQVTLGQPITYIVKVTNKGPNPATGVRLTNTLPTGATASLVTPSTGSCTATGPVVCSLGTLADQGTATVTIVATPASAGTARDTSTVKAQQVDPDPATNTAQIQTTVAAPQTSPGGAAGGSNGTSGLVARIVSLHGKRIHGRAHVTAGLNVNRAVRARLTLLYRGRAIASTSAPIAHGSRSLTLVAKRKTPAGRYVLRAVLTDRGGKGETLSVSLRLR